MIDTVDGKINTVQIFFRGGVHARTSFDFFPHFQSILFGLAPEAGDCFFGDLF